MKSVWSNILGVVAWVSTACFCHGQDSVPAGYDSFFPKGYTQPKMAVGGNSVAIVGPTPYFEKREVSGSKVNVQDVKVQSEKDRLKATEEPMKLDDGNTELMMYATKGDLEGVKDLLHKGANVNTRNKYGSTALMGASAGGFNEIVELLLKNKANLNAKGKGGSTALLYARKNGHEYTAKLLLDAGARDESKASASSKPPEGKNTK